MTKKKTKTEDVVYLEQTVKYLQEENKELEILVDNLMGFQAKLEAKNTKLKEQLKKANKSYNELYDMNIKESVNYSNDVRLHDRAFNEAIKLVDNENLKEALASLNALKEDFENKHDKEFDYEENEFGVCEDDGKDKTKM